MFDAVRAYLTVTQGQFKMDILVLIVFGLLATVLAVKVRFTFDINRWMESKRESRSERREEKLKAKCPHATFIKEGDQYGFESTFSSPPGTLDYRCRKCGLVTDDIRGSKYIIARFASNPKLYFKQVKAFERDRKKMYG